MFNSVQTEPVPYTTECARPGSTAWRRTKWCRASSEGNDLFHIGDMSTLDCFLLKEQFSPIDPPGLLKPQMLFNLPPIVGGANFRTGNISHFVNTAWLKKKKKSVKIFRTAPVT